MRFPLRWIDQLLSLVGLELSIDVVTYYVALKPLIRGQLVGDDDVLEERKIYLVIKRRRRR